MQKIFKKLDDLWVYKSKTEKIFTFATIFFPLVFNIVFVIIIPSIAPWIKIQCSLLNFIIAILLMIGFWVTANIFIYNSLPDSCYPIMTLKRSKHAKQYIENLFKNSNSVKIMPLENPYTNVYTIIREYIIDITKRKNWISDNCLRISVGYNDKAIIQYLVESDKLSFTAERIGKKNYIGFCYNGNIYKKAIKWNNYAWFKHSFEVIE